MEVNSVSTVTPNTHAVQQQIQSTRAKEVENDNDNDDMISKAAAGKLTAQNVSTEKANLQKLVEKISEEQVSTRPSANARGQIVGTIINTQA